MRSVKTVLITGGAGYIGSVLVTLLLNQGYYVRTIDNLSYGGAALLACQSQSNFEFIAGDIRNVKDIDRALEGVDAVIHLAAVVGDKACRENPKLATEVNKTASEMLCEKAVAHRVRQFIFASTCSNYGKTGTSGTGNTEDRFVDESSPLHPVSLYAELKVGFEKYLLNIGLPNFTPTCLRFATAYGLSGRPRFDLTLNEFVKELVMDRKLEVYGERSWRPYCHVADLARACQLVLEASPLLVAYQTFNVGDTSENYQKKKLVELILNELADKRDNITYVFREQDPRDYKVNCDKIKTQLGFSISRRVPDGIKEIIFGITSGLIENPDDSRFRNA
ncbi:MAG: NAD-dependent epimerase/dehydratase family protein [Candidatus Zixiibacteriota bacterium]